MHLRPLLSLAVLFIAVLFSARSSDAITPILHFGGVEAGIADIVTDTAGNIYLCGATARPGKLPGRANRLGSTGGEYDAYVMKFLPDGTPAAAVVIGGSHYDSADRIAIDVHGNVVIAGYSSSTNFPVNNALSS